MCGPQGAALLPPTVVDGLCAGLWHAAFWHGVAGWGCVGAGCFCPTYRATGCPAYGSTRNGTHSPQSAGRAGAGFCPPAGGDCACQPAGTRENRKNTYTHQILPNMIVILTATFSLNLFTNESAGFCCLGFISIPFASNTRLVGRPSLWAKLYHSAVGLSACGQQGWLPPPCFRPADRAGP